MDWLRRRTMNRAHQLVRIACLRGDLVEPATREDCGEEVRLDAHHDDYSRPLAVRWLCPCCHKRHHVALANLKGRRVGARG